MNLLKWASAALASFAISTTAQATTMVAHIKGFGDGSIQTGDFGEHNTSFLNAPFSSTFVYDTDVGQDTSGPGVVGRLGGIFRTSDPDPVSSATLRIKGLEFQFSDDFFQGYWSKGYPSGPFGLDAERDDNIDDTLLFSLSAHGLTSDPAQSFTSSDGGTGFASWSATLFPETAWGAFMRLRVSHFDVEPLSQSTGDLAVPEPAVWLEMILGFATLGALARRRRQDDPLATG